MNGQILHYPTFFLSLTLGILCVYALCPKKHVVCKFVSPYRNEDIEKITHHDQDTGQCYRLRAEKSACPSKTHESKIVSLP